MSTITTPSVWFTQSAPTSGRNNALFIWEEAGTYLQLAVGIAVPSPNPYAPSITLLKLSSEENNLADADLYNNVIRNVVAAYKTNGLRLEYANAVNEALSPVPTNAPKSATNALPSILVRVAYTIDTTDTLQVSISVTDSHGFVLARNTVAVITTVSTTPTVTENLDLLVVPLSTQAISEQGNFSSATLLPAKNLTLTTYKALPVMWYNTISTIVPPTINMKQIALWRKDGQIKVSLALPLDELLTKPTSTLVRGTVSDLASSQLCTTKWWYMVDLTHNIASNNEALVNKIIAAANQGILFISDRVSADNSSSINPAHHSVTGSVTVTFGLGHGNAFASAIGTFYRQHVSVYILDGEGTLLKDASHRVRMSCGSNDLIFPSDGVLLSLPCSQGNCGNPYHLERLADHGDNIGINVLQGRGGIPTGTSITTGERASYLDLSRQVVNSLSNYSTYQNYYAILTDSPAKVYLPYMGRLTSVHTNSPARAAVLGYSHYYYPDSYQPLDIGYIETFGTHVTGTNYNTWTSSNTAIVSDDDSMFAIAEAEKNKAVFLCIPNYPSTNVVTRQEPTKEVKLFLPGRDRPHTTLTAKVDLALTMDLSTLRVPTPVFNMNYDTPIVEYLARVTYNNNTLTFRSENTSQCGGNLFIGFSGRVTVTAWNLRHTLKLPTSLGTTRAYTGFTNYPEYAVPFTIGSPAYIGGGPPVVNPLVPTFTGRLPPNYRMVWVDWTSLTATNITVKYWAGEAAYNLNTVYNGFSGNNITTLTLPIVPGTDSAVETDGSVVLRVGLEKHNDALGILKLYAGNVLIAESTSTATMVPWVHAGSFYFHAHGDNRGIDDVVFGTIGATEGTYSVTSTLDTVSADYVELAVESITGGITASNYRTLDLKPYRLYWSSTEKALYIPVLTSTAHVPTRLAKCDFFASSTTTPSNILELLNVDTPTQRVFLSAKHGLANLPTGTHHVFTSNDTNTGDGVIEFYWRKGTNYGTVIGPMTATIVNGVTVPTAVLNTSTGEDVNVQTYLKTIATGEYNNAEILSTGVLLNGLLNSTAYIKLPVWFKSDVQKYTIHLSRKSQGVWQSLSTEVSHLAVYLFPTRSSALGIPTLPLVERLQRKAIRLLIPRNSGEVIVQTSLYRGYTWDVAGQSSGRGSNDTNVDTVTSYALSGTGILSTDSKTVIAITLFNVSGMLGFTLYENHSAKLSGTIPVPFFNNGTVAFALQNAGTQASEFLTNLYITPGEKLSFDELSQGGQTELVAEGTSSSGTVYCVPTMTISRHIQVSNGTQSVIQIPSTAKYGYLDYTLTNNSLTPVTVELHLATHGIGPNTLIFSGTLQPNTSRQQMLVYMHKNEELVIVVNGNSAVDVSAVVITQS